MANHGVGFCSTNVSQGVIFLNTDFLKMGFYECQEYGRNAFLALLPCHRCLT